MHLSPLRTGPIREIPGRGTMQDAQMRLSTGDHPLVPVAEELLLPWCFPEQQTIAVE